MNSENAKQSELKKVLFICSAQAWYIRTEYVLNLLKNNYDLVSIASNKKRYPARIIEVLSKFFQEKKNINKYDFIFIGFFAQILIPIVRIFYKGHLVADYFISLYDTLCFDRKLVKPNSIFGSLVYRFEKWTLKFPSLILVDTENSKKYFVENFAYPPKKIKVLYVLADSNMFFPPVKTTKVKDQVTIFFYSSGRLLHGLDIILKAIKIIQNKNEDIKFTLLGPIRESVRSLVEDIDKSNVNFIEWVDYNDLPKYIAPADICLGGHFGNTEKAGRVIAGKTFQFALMKKALILGENMANKELFTDGINCLMVKMDDETLLAEAIMKLKKDIKLREKIAEEAYNTVINIKPDLNFLESLAEKNN